MRRGLKTALVVACCAGAVPAGAGTLLIGTDVTITTIDDTEPTGNFGAFYVGAERVTGNAGRYRISGTTGSGDAFDLYTFCIDALIPLGAYSPMRASEIGLAVLDPVKQRQLAGLMTNANALIDAEADADRKSLLATATALAVWEIIYEPGTTGYAMSAGVFHVDPWYDLAPFMSAADDLLLQNWLAPAGRIAALLPTDPGRPNQPQIFLTAVPEPAKWAMLLFGFAVVGCALRRSRRGGENAVTAG